MRLAKTGTYGIQFRQDGKWEGHIMLNADDFALVISAFGEAIKQAIAIRETGNERIDAIRLINRDNDTVLGETIFAKEST